jgi:hypothetical protein
MAEVAEVFLHEQLLSRRRKLESALSTAKGSASLA